MVAGGRKRKGKKRGIGKKIKHHSAQALFSSITVSYSSLFSLSLFLFLSLPLLLDFIGKKYNMGKSQRK